MHGAETTHLPHKLRDIDQHFGRREGSKVTCAHPVIDLPVFLSISGVRDLVVLVVPVHQILHDGTALKQPDGRAIGEGVRQGRETPIGVDLKEPRLLGAWSVLSIPMWRVG